jgi:hypothetical protein
VAKLRGSFELGTPTVGQAWSAGKFIVFQFFLGVAATFFFVSLFCCVFAAIGGSMDPQTDSLHGVSVNGISIGKWCLAISLRGLAREFSSLRGIQKQKLQVSQSFGITRCPKM